jgi:pimeloyl-ACP methyl ester carboxylesterase
MYNTEMKLFYLERGHGQPVILIHGTLNDFRIWQFHIVGDMHTQINGLEMVRTTA